MNWIRMATTLPDDPKLHELAAALKVSPDIAIAKFARVLFKLPEHARNGNLANVLPATVEAWAEWRGKRGAFDQQFRRLFCDDSGTVRAWEKHNGAAMRRADEDRERKRTMRGSPPAVRNVSAGQTADRPPDKMRDVTLRDVDGTTELPDTNAEGKQFLSGAGPLARGGARPAPQESARGKDGKPTRLSFDDLPALHPGDAA